ncbi:MAG TPA: hypothetical protein VLZ30_11225 [Verrucomicrobiae bacterium]|nr:hypothetical protein [Verrucomicrobiae bacterium]
MDHKRGSANGATTANGGLGQPALPTARRDTHTIRFRYTTSFGGQAGITPYKRIWNANDSARGTQRTAAQPVRYATPVKCWTGTVGVN